jgi:hypothetical protein
MTFRKTYVLFAKCGIIVVGAVKTFATRIPNDLTYMPLDGQVVPCTLGQMRTTSIGLLSVQINDQHLRPTSVTGALAIVRGSRNPDVIDRGGSLAIQNKLLVDMGEKEGAKATKCTMITVAPTSCLVNFSLTKSPTS